jgi:hypothetical protein
LPIVVYVKKDGVQLMQGDKRGIVNTGWVLLNFSFFTCTGGGVLGLAAQVHYSQKKGAPPTPKDVMGVYPLKDPFKFFDFLEPTNAVVDAKEFYGAPEHDGAPLSVYHEYLLGQKEAALSEDKSTCGRL